jgi:DNA polymerase-1
LTGRGKKGDIMILNEYPGLDEDSQGRAFEGSYARFIEKQIMKNAGISTKECFFDNAVKCRTPGNRKPSRKEVMNCRPYLEKTIEAVKPKVIILMGNAALCSTVFLDKNSGITRWRGKPLWSREFNCWMIATHGPDSLMADKRHNHWFKLEQTIADFKKAAQLSQTRPPDFEMPEYKALSTPSSITKYLRAAIDSGVVAVDLETDRFDPRNEILGMSLCFKSSNGKYYPIYVAWNDIDEPEETSDLLHEMLESKDVQKLFQNVSFDRKFLHFHGYPLKGPVDDTMVMAHLLDENFSVGLKERTWTDLYFGGYDIPLEKYKIEHKFTKNTSYKEIPFDVMAPYAAYDTLATYMLYEEFLPRLEEEELLPLYSKISMPVRMVMTKAEINGIYVDMKQVAEVRARCEKAQKNLEKKIYELAGEEFNFMSTQQLAKKLFEEMGAPNLGRTKKGNWICDKNALKKAASGKKRNPATHIALAVMKYKYIEKAKGTYLGGAEKNVWDDGRIHSSYNSTGTVTGRVSNSNPCTHNIPKDKLVRSLYGPSPGNVLVEADIKAAEMRTIAVESGDETLINIIESGQDIHNQTFNAMFDKPADYVPNDKERRIAKSINFGLIFGITAVGLSRRLGISIDQGQYFIDTYFKKFSGVAEWIRDTVKFAHEHGYVVSLFKRRRRLLEIESDDDYVMWRAERQAMNSPIQSAAADYTYIGLIRVDTMLEKLKLRARIIHTVHDCILVDTPVEEVAMVKKVIAKAFRTPVKAFPMLMDVDIEEGSAWGEHGDDSELDKILTDLAA